MATAVPKEAARPRGLWGSDLRPGLVLVVPAAVGALALAGVTVLVAGGWLGETGSAGLVYCEASHAGLIKQPANTWSNLAFLVAGALVSRRAYRDLSSPADGAPNRMTASLFYPTLYACTAMLLGPASMALHATTTVCGGKVDVFSMYLWVAFTIAYACTRLAELDRGAFLLVLLAVLVPLTTQLVFDVPAVSGNLLFGLSLAAYAALEARIVLGGERQEYERGWLGLALGSFLLALTIWIASRTGGPLCAPRSALQGHAIWHVLNAVAVWALYRLYRSQRRLRDGSGHTLKRAEQKHPVDRASQPFESSAIPLKTLVPATDAWRRPE